MAQSKHTPGPWKFEGSIYEHMAAEIVAERGIAQLWQSPNAIADARLIAAAPDLLAALKEAQVVIDADAEVETYSRISAAISKAEGTP